MYIQFSLRGKIKAQLETEAMNPFCGKGTQELAPSQAPGRDWGVGKLGGKSSFWKGPNMHGCTQELNYLIGGLNNFKNQFFCLFGREWLSTQ